MFDVELNKDLEVYGSGKVFRFALDMVLISIEKPRVARKIEECILNICRIDLLTSIRRIFG